MFWILECVKARRDHGASVLRDRGDGSEIDVASFARQWSNFKVLSIETP
jgi:hypothetical protein